MQDDRDGESLLLAASRQRECAKEAECGSTVAELFYVRSKTVFVAFPLSVKAQENTLCFSPFPLFLFCLDVCAANTKLICKNGIFSA